MTLRMVCERETLECWSYQWQTHTKCDDHPTPPRKWETAFDPQRGGVHRDDPRTSYAAATNPINMVRWGTQRHAILHVFDGGIGRTPDEAGLIARVSGYNQRRRCSELVRDGLLIASGDERDGCQVLVITEAGEAALRSARPDEN